jgi:hypothetical protein
MRGEWHAAPIAVKNNAPPMVQCSEEEALVLGMFSHYLPV